MKNSLALCCYNVQGTMSIDAEEMDPDHIQKCQSLTDALDNANSQD